ncbi:MAG: YchJ family metal-binding protein [Pseudomonadota bacterium]
MTADQVNMCWCGNPSRDACCGPLLAGAHATTAEALMRSRYSAYVLRDVAYLEKTWQPAHRPPSLQLDDRQKWLGLKIIAIDAGTSDDDVGIVEFVARYKIAGRGYRLHERSNFVKSKGHWYYTSGQVIE